MVHKDGKVTEREMVRAACDGNKAALVELRSRCEDLVSRIALLYDNMPETHEELVSQGMSRFEQAVASYCRRETAQRATKGTSYRFSTYFTWWATRDIERGLKESDP